MVRDEDMCLEKRRERDREGERKRRERERERGERPKTRRLTAADPRLPQMDGSSSKLSLTNDKVVL